MAETLHHLVAQKKLRRPAVEELTGLSRSTIYDLMSKGASPRPVDLTRKAVAWPEAAIAEWLDQREPAKDKLPPPGLGGRGAGRS